MRIVIDLQGAQSESRFRGIGRYSLSLTQAILRNKGDHEVLVALNGMFVETVEPLRAALEGLIPQQNIRVWFAPGPVTANDPTNQERVQISELMRESFLAALEPDVVLLTSLFDGFGDDTVASIGQLEAAHKTVAVLYDLIPLVQADVYLKPNQIYERFYRTKLEYLKRADAWLTISDNSLNEAVEYLQLTPALITNISAACDPIFTKLDAALVDQPGLLQRFSLAKDFVLYSGGADPRKNLTRLLSVYSKLPQEVSDKFQLVIAGKIPAANMQSLRRYAQTCAIPDHKLVFTGNVTDLELCRLYNACTAYVFPSLHEGFGLPVLEAMSCGAPVIAANASSLPEVVGDERALFDPLDEQDFLSKLTRVLTDEDFRQSLIEQGNKNITQYSWDACANKALQALERLGPARPLDKTEINAQRLLQGISQLTSSLTDDELMRCAAMIALNQPRFGPKKLFVDISELARHDAATGVQRVTRSILFELLKHPPEGFQVVPVYGTTTELGYRQAKSFVTKFMAAEPTLPSGDVDEIIETQPGDIFLGLDLQHQVTRYQSPYLSALRARGVGVYFVVYDLLPIQFPQFWPCSLGTAHSEWLHTLAQFDGALCISKAVADELVQWRASHIKTLLRPYKIDWFHLGADIDNSKPSRGVPEDGQAVLATLSSRPTFLSVGTIEPRKAHDVTLAAFENLWSQGMDINLVLVGKKGWLVEALIEKLQTHPQRGIKLFWLAGVSDEYLGKIYDAATCLITASLGEGFGLPLIEAAQHNKPIIARDIPVFREVAGDYATYFSGDASNLAQTVTSWLATNRAGVKSLDSKITWLTWAQSAEQLKKILINSV